MSQENNTKYDLDSQAITESDIVNIRGVFAGMLLAGMAFPSPTYLYAACKVFIEEMDKSESGHGFYASRGLTFNERAEAAIRHFKSDKENQKTIELLAESLKSMPSDNSDVPQSTSADSN